MGCKTFADTIDNVGSFTIQKVSFPKSILCNFQIPVYPPSFGMLGLEFYSYLGLQFCNLDWREDDFVAQCYQCRCFHA